MAKCKLCEKSSWFLRVNEDGLCKNCQPVVYSDLHEHTRILEQCIEIIDKSKNIDTILSRLDIGLEHLEKLRKYELRRIPTVHPSPSEAIENWKQHKVDATLKFLEKDLVVAQDKSSNAKTFSGKTGPFNKLLEKITKYQIELEDISELEIFEQKIRHEVANTVASFYLEQAEKAEFKGQAKKAIDQCLEALYAMRNDPVPDNQQAEMIERAETKIRSLGGTVPS